MTQIRPGMALPLARTIAPSDQSTSTVLPSQTTPQIRPAEDGLTLRSDIVYATRTLADGRALDLKVDVFTHNEAAAPKPLVLYVSGGGFLVSLRPSARDLRSYVAQAGFVVASIDYRALTTGPGITFADSVADVKSAIRFLRANAAEFGIAPAHVGAWGESAGGYLVSMVGASNGTDRFVTEDIADLSSDVQAVVDKFGASDLTRVAADFDESAQAFWSAPDGPLAAFVYGPGGGPLDEHDAPAVESNPLTHLNPATPPFLLFHGNADSVVSPSQTLLLHNALRAAGLSSRRYVLDGANHGDAPFLGDPEVGRVWSTTTAMDLIVEFLRAELR